MQQLFPINPHERETFMDVLRGFAILGIFIANLGTGFSGYRAADELAGPFLLGTLDHKMSFLHQMFIEGKFYSIFSLLFGWGLALQFKRAESHGMNALPTVRRRLTIMLLLGAIHLLIWPGDIVFFYAMLGFVLLPFRKLTNKQLLVTGTCLVLSPILLYAAKMQWPIWNAPSELLFNTGRQVDEKVLNIHSQEDYFNFIKNAGWWDLLKSNLSGFFYRFGYLFFVSRIPKVLGMFMIGYALGRSGFYQNFTANKKMIYGIAILGFVIGLPANYLLANYISNFEGDYWNLKLNGFYQTVAYALGVATLAMAYVASFMIAFQSRFGKKILSVIAPVGKMAFTNYIMQSFIGYVVFQPAGLGYFGQLGPVYYTLFGMAVFMMQIMLSTVWLRYFNYGPIEWLWRSATYKKWQPMRKQVETQLVLS